jgi:hypothetical protein
MQSKKVPMLYKHRRLFFFMHQFPAARQALGEKTLVSEDLVLQKNLVDHALSIPL